MKSNAEIRDDVIDEPRWDPQVPNPTPSAITVSVRASGGVRRARRAVSPWPCSANVTAPQSGFPQKNRRTASRIVTGWPPTGASASRRS